MVSRMIWTCSGVLPRRIVPNVTLSWPKDLEPVAADLLPFLLGEVEVDKRQHLALFEVEVLGDLREQVSGCSGQSNLFLDGRGLAPVGRLDARVIERAGHAGMLGFHGMHQGVDLVGARSSSLGQTSKSSPSWWVWRNVTIHWT